MHLYDKKQCILFFRQLHWNSENFSLMSAANYFACAAYIGLSPGKGFAVALRTHITCTSLTMLIVCM